LKQPEVVLTRDLLPINLAITNIADHDDKCYCALSSSVSQNICNLMKYISWLK